MVFIVLFFFVKQKAAYELRISDWSSDVCSSDLPKGRRSVMKSTIFLALAASPLALVATAMPVAAQDSADQSMANASMDDIVVTARRREESLQSVPVSITAISSDMLEQKSVQDLSDVATLTPGFRFRSEEHTSELQSLMRISYAVFCLTKKKITHH